MGICWLPLTQKEYPALLRDCKAQHWNKIWRVSLKVPEKSISLGELWHCGGPVVFLLENCNTPQKLTPDISKFKYDFGFPSQTSGGKGPGYVPGIRWEFLRVSTRLDG